MTEVHEIALTDIVDHPDQPRYSAGDVATLAASIEAEGHLEPVLVVDHNPEPKSGAAGNCYTVVSGHRRVAALRHLGRSSVKVVVLPFRGRENELRALLAANTTHENLTPVEEARGFQTLLDLGVPIATVAKAVGRKRAYVEQAAGVAKATAPERVPELVQKAVSLQEAEALARHQDDPEIYEQLLKVVGRDDFEWQARSADENAKRKAVYAKVSAKLQAAGTKIVKRDYGAKQGAVGDLLDGEGKKLTAKSHASCPGHAAVINQYTTSERGAIEYICTDWAKHGHSHAYRKDGGDTSPWKEQQRADTRWRRRMKDSLETRRAWLSGKITGNWAAAELGHVHAFLLGCALQRGFDGGAELGCKLLGLKVESADPHGLNVRATWADQEQALRDHADPLRAMLALACAAGDEATRLSHAPGQSYYRDGAAKRYLGFLEAFGYELTDVERELVQAKKAELDRRSVNDPERQSELRRCRVCGCSDEEACDDGLESCHWVEDDLCSACVEKGDGEP